MNGMETAVSLISTVGFPIVCVIFLWKFVTNTMQNFTDAMNKFNVTMAENTQMLQKVYERLERDEDRDAE